VVVVAQRKEPVCFNWSVTCEPDGSEIPSVPQIVAFIRDYEMASDHLFSNLEWHAAGDELAVGWGRALPAGSV